MPPGMGAWQPERPLHGWVSGEKPAKGREEDSGIGASGAWRGQRTRRKRREKHFGERPR